jgi:hypothetical protein
VITTFRWNRLSALAAESLLLRLSATPALGDQAEILLDAISQKGLHHAASRTRLVQIGTGAGATISLLASTLRSSGLKLIGRGLGSVSIKGLFRSIAEFLREAAKKPFQIKIKTTALRDVEAIWNAPEQGTRLVFQP